LNNVLLIGATGFLGQHLTTLGPQIATTRFEDPADAWQQYQGINTVWLVARACRKTYPRRDAETKRIELNGIQNICNVFSDCHFVYTSTKVVYGLTDDDVRTCSREHIGNLFVHKFPHVQNVPHTDHDTVNLEPLGEEHRIYAETKLAAEDIIKSTVKSCSILRIWDIC
jgi:nucleoside-diphosphate-sugar epimerase